MRCINIVNKLKLKNWLLNIYNHSFTRISRTIFYFKISKLDNIFNLKIKPALKSLPSEAHKKKSLDVENRSAIVKSVNNNIPVIKPNCTADVKPSIALLGKLKFSIKSFDTALPANHKEVQQNCEIMIIGSIHLWCFISITNSIEKNATFKLKIS